MSLTPYPTIRLKVIPGIPGTVSGQSPVTVTKTGTDFRVSVDVNALQAAIEPGILLSMLAELFTANVQEVTAGGAVTVGANTIVLVINKAAPSVTPCTLPTLAARAGRWLFFFDFAGNGGDVTFTPAGAEKIMGLAGGAAWTFSSGGAGAGGAGILIPRSAIGWGVIA